MSDENENETEDGSVQMEKKLKNPFRLQKTKEEKERRQKKRARLIVRNISYKVTEDVLKNHFEQWGEVEDLNLLKRPDGRIVGCAFVQFATITQATKSILKGNNQPLLERPIYIDWAVGKDEYVRNKQQKQNTKIKTEEEKVEIKEEDEETQSKSRENDEDNEDEQKEDDDDEEEDEDDKKEDEDDDDQDELKSELKIKKLKKEKHISNDVNEGCTVFIKNIPFDASDEDLRKVVRKYGPIFYAIINRQAITGHSKGTAFVKFKRKESADLCLIAGSEFILMNEVLEVHPALSRDEITKQTQEKENGKQGKDSRNLYLAREGLIMAGSKAAQGVSASDMSKRHKLEQIKTEVLKNLNRFVSRNRLSIHNLPLSFNNDKLKELVMKTTGYRPHECRVMRENKITAESPEGQSKGFGFMSFSTHQEALSALRKLNNNPNVFGPQKRAIVAFSIEDRSVHRLKETRKQKSKMNNPTFKRKQETVEEFKKQLKVEKQKKGFLTNDDKSRVKKEIKKVEKLRADKEKAKAQTKVPTETTYDEYVGMASKEGSNIKMRSNKKITEQSKQHMKRVKAEKRKEKQKKIRQIHLQERKQIDRPKQGRKREKDDISHLVNKYKQMLDSKVNPNEASKAKKPKRTKWYKE